MGNQQAQSLLWLDWLCQKLVSLRPLEDLDFVSEIWGSQMPFLNSIATGTKGEKETCLRKPDGGNRNPPAAISWMGD